MTISFVGRSYVAMSDKVKEIVKEQIINSITDAEHITCYLGGRGDFDEICARVLRELKRDYPEIEMVYVTPYMSLSEQAKIKEMQRRGLYDYSIYPPIENALPRFSILKRNEWMMENADLVIAYVNRSYGGAYKTLQFAIRRKKNIINIYDLLQ